MKINRRAFLKTTGATDAGLLIVPRLFADDAPSKVLHIAQIGCGRMGGSLLRGCVFHRRLRIEPIGEIGGPFGRGEAEDRDGAHGLNCVTTANFKVLRPFAGTIHPHICLNR